MCGICGYITNKDITIEARILNTMTDALSHRGPDDRGIYTERTKDNISVGLGHRRLSIIDLSKDAAQPMSNEDSSLWIVFNGEIYNFLDLKPSLIKNGHTFKSASDTEVIIHLYEEFGEDCLNYLNGMFAFCIWDNKKNILFAARDRIGEKPFFYTECDGVLLFASEIKSLINYPFFKKELDIMALQKYLAFEYVPAPRSIFKNVSKLPAGNLLKWQNGKIQIRKYWDLRLSKSERSFLPSEDECRDRIRTLLLNSVKKRLISDVPLGIFLSGGIDSSAILSLMAEFVESHKIKSFSIGFEDKSFDESNYARSLAKFFKTDHHERILTPENLLEIVPRISDFLDEPLADASIIPAYLLSQFTRRFVTVAIGGDGGDELFAGYPTFQADKFIDFFFMLPHFLKKTISTICENAVPVSFDNISFDFKIKQFLRGGFYPPLIRHFVWMGSFTPDAQTQLLKEPILDHYKDLYSDIYDILGNHHPQKRINALLYLYTKFYLQNDILTKVDTTSMANSLEVRAPFLDVELLDFIEKVPWHYKIRLLTTKYILKKSFSDRLPKYILKRPKKGFGIPVAKWLRNELKEFVLSSLSEKQIKKAGIFNLEFIHSLLAEHFSGKRDNRKALWTLLTFQQWYKRFFL